MNANERWVPTRFGPETRFEARPAPAPFRAVLDTEFERLAERLLRKRLEAGLRPALSVRVRRAANEAAALAWLTPYPLLVFPTLFDEKVAEARTRAARQDEIRERSRELLAA
jgi:hypothetical protein